MGNARGVSLGKQSEAKEVDVPREGVSSDTDHEGLSQTDSGRLVDGLVVERSGSRDDS